MTPHPDLAAEQAYLDHAHERLSAMRAAAREMKDEALGRAGGGTHQALVERDVIVQSSLRRLDQLDIGDRPLCFGRIDRAPASPGDGDPGESFHIGRVAVWDEAHEPVVVDWRAPVAEPFYRATGLRPMGLTRRRHFATDGRRLVGIEDELFGRGRPGADRVSAGEDGVGTPPSSTLLAALERSRSPHMADIVATVQREQDEVIRSPLAGVLVVQGGPGTGKTAVALHRAAYLLYTHRFPLERQGVLVVGPNQVFLRYIDQVLPSLGESGVAVSTIQGLVPHARVRGADSRQVAALKGDARMAAVVANAVRDRQRPLRRDVVVGLGSARVRLLATDTERAVAAGRRRRGTHNARRRVVESELVGTLAARYRRHLEGLGADTTALDDQETARAIRQLPAVGEALQRIWPRLTAEELLHDLFGAPPLLRMAASGRLEEEEAESLFRPRSAALGAIPWTQADLALLDEAGVLLGPADPRGEETRTYGHIVVDEAQDLSPMALRMLTRRSLSGSMTVVGDIAQATGPSAPASWDEVLLHLPDRRAPRVVELSVNYRAPAELIAAADRLLGQISPGLEAPRAVRAGGGAPVMTRVGSADLAAEVATRARADATAGGTVAVIAPDSLLAGLEAQLGVTRRDGLATGVNLLDVELVKGLEFDSVVVVEPAGIVAEHGPRGLYVALSRATRRLRVLHARGLPYGLADDLV